MVETVLKAKADSLEEVTVKVPVLLPHRVLDYLFNVLKIEISAAELKRFWDHCQRFCEWAKFGISDGSHIPVGLYGDTARYGSGFDQSKVTGCFLSLVLWRPKSTRMSLWLLWNLNGALSLGFRSHNPLYLAVVQSLNAAYDGVTPEGNPLGHKFCVTQLKGDWEYHWQTLRLRRYWKTRFICWRCDAENHPHAEHSFVDVMSDAPSWLTTLKSHNDFVVNMVRDDYLCILGGIVGPGTA